MKIKSAPKNLNNTNKCVPYRAVKFDEQWLSAFYTARMRSVGLKHCYKL